MPEVFWNLTWGDFTRMQRGFFRKREHEATNTAVILAAIKNTNSTKIGNIPWEASDFLNTGEKTPIANLEDRQKLAEQAVENSKRFDRGVVHLKDW